MCSLRTYSPQILRRERDSRGPVPKMWWTCHLRDQIAWGPALLPAEKTPSSLLGWPQVAKNHILVPKIRRSFDRAAKKSRFEPQTCSASRATIALLPTELLVVSRPPLSGNCAPTLCPFPLAGQRRQDAGSVRALPEAFPPPQECGGRWHRHRGELLSPARRP